MKNPLQTLAIAGIITVSIASSALAGDRPLSREEQRTNQSADYWNKSGKTVDSRTTSDSKPHVSQYPCANCVYDSQLGGYVKKSYGKN